MQDLYQRFRYAWSDTVEQLESLQGVTNFLAALQCSGVQNRCSVKRAEALATPEKNMAGASCASARGENRNVFDASTKGAPVVYEESTLPSNRSARPEVEEGLDDQRNGAVQSARSTCTTSSEPEVTSQEREREKVRLQRLLRDFAKEAVAGISVSLLNPVTGRKPPYFFQMDKHLVMFSLRPKDGTAVDFPGQDFRMLDIKCVSKAHDLYSKIPALGTEATWCVGLDMTDRCLILYFDSAYERDKFYTSMQVLILSVGIQQSR